MKEGHNHSGWERPMAGSLPIHVVSLLGSQGERRLPIDIIKQDLRSLPATTWIAFHGDTLGEPLAYATDLIRRMGPLKHQWTAQASLTLAAKPELLHSARQNGCRALSFDGEQISAQYLTTEALVPQGALSDLATSLRQLAAHGILSVVRFVFGYDTDDEGVFERTAHFCRDARIGLPLFSVFTPPQQSALFLALEREGRLVNFDHFSMISPAISEWPVLDLRVA
jgi:hypothetical protein